MPHSSGGGSHSSGGSSGGYSSSHSSGGGSHSSGRYSTELGGSRGYRTTTYYRDYRPNMNKYVYYYHNKPYYYYSTERYKESGSKASAFLALFILIVFAVILGFSMSACIKKPEKLPTNYETGVIIKDSIGVMTDEEQVQLYAVMYDFYKETGITPALVTAYNSEWENYYSDITYFAYDEYVNLFDDESHWLFVYTTDEDISDFDDWYWEGMQGDDTDDILTTSVTNRFNDTVQKGLTKRDTSVSEAFMNGFYEITPSIMDTSIDVTGLFAIGFFEVAIIASIIITIATIFSPKKKEMQKAVKLNPDKVDIKDTKEDTCEYCGGVYVHGIHISCPHCGASIAPMGA